MSAKEFPLTEAESVITVDRYEVEYSERVEVEWYEDPDTGKKYWAIKAEEQWEEI